MEMGGRAEVCVLLFIHCAAKLGLVEFVFFERGRGSGGGFVLRIRWPLWSLLLWILWGGGGVVLAFGRVVRFSLVAFI